MTKKWYQHKGIISMCFWLSSLDSGVICIYGGLLSNQIIATIKPKPSVILRVGNLQQNCMVSN